VPELETSRTWVEMQLQCCVSSRLGNKSSNFYRIS